MSIALRGRGIRVAVGLSVLAAAGAGCAMTGPGGAAGSLGCGVASTWHLAAAVSGSGASVSAVPGSAQAWALVEPHIVGGAEAGPFVLLHLSGLNWAKAATLRRAGPLGGDFLNLSVTAISGRAAWVWGWNPARAGSFLALASGGTVRPVHLPWLRTVVRIVVASDGPADTWVAGSGPGSTVEFAHWNGRSWRLSRAPGTEGGGEGPEVTSLSTSGPENAWAAILDPGAGWPTEWVLHWNGAAWTKSYAAPVRFYQGGYGPDPLSVASSPGRAWVVYTQENAPAGPNSGPGSPNGVPVGESAYFDGTRWTAVRVPRPFRWPLQVTMSGPDAWTISAVGPAIMHSYRGGRWCARPLPRPSGDRCHRLPHYGSSTVPAISEASPAYVVATDQDLRGCTFVYVYDGQR
jgi:hypothetical protein